MNPNLLLWLGAGSVGLAVLAAISAFGVLDAHRRDVSKTLVVAHRMRIAAGRSAVVDESASFFDRVLRPAGGSMLRIGLRLSPAGAVDQIQKRLDTAGNPVGWSVDRIFACKGLGLLIGAFIGLLYGHSTVGLAVFLAGGFGAFGFFTPNILLYNAGLKRQLLVRSTMADSIDLLVVCVQAGLGFDAGLSQVARRGDGPIASEFSRVLQEIQIGKRRSEALGDFGERVNVAEARNFAQAIVQADALGIPVARVLHEQAKELRVKRQQLAEERAQKLPVKLLFPMLFLIFPALMVLVAGPAAINVSHLFSH
ncbi:MAG: type II secretion system F family protein [Actinomycetota bacterium]